MDIAATATGMSQLETVTQHASKMNSLVKDQMEATGQQIMHLLETSTPRPVDPSSPLGQNIDIKV